MWHVVCSVLILFFSLCSFAQSGEWVRTESKDELHNKIEVKFAITSKEDGGGIGVTCSGGKLEHAWLVTDKIADSDSDNYIRVEYRRNDDPKPHRMSLPVSDNFHGVLLQERHGIGSAEYGFEELLYGSRGQGKQNKQTNHWAKHLVIGVSAYNDAPAVYSFDVPDPSKVLTECADK